MKKTLLSLLLLWLAVAASAGRCGKNCKEKLFKRCYGSKFVKDFMATQDAVVQKCFGSEMPRRQVDWRNMKLPRELLEKFMEESMEGSDPSSSESWEHEYPPNYSMEEPIQDSVDLGLTVSFPSTMLFDVMSMVMGKGTPLTKGRRGWSDRGSFGSDMSIGRGFRGMGGRRKGWDGGEQSPEDEEDYGIPGRFRGGSSVPYGVSKEIMSGDVGDVLEQLASTFAAKAMTAQSRKKRSPHHHSSEERDQYSSEGLMGLAMSEEKFIARLEELQQDAEAMIGNMTCVMHEMGFVDAEGNLDKDRTLGNIDALSIEDKWLLNKSKSVISSCYASSMALPKEYHRLFQIEEKWGRALSFIHCVEKSAMQVCKNSGVRNDLKDEYGSISDLVEKTGIDEDAVLTLAGPVAMSWKYGKHGPIGGMKEFMDNFYIPRLDFRRVY